MPGTNALPALRLLRHTFPGHAGKHIPVGSASASLPQTFPERYDGEAGALTTRQFIPG